MSSSTPSTSPSSLANSKKRSSPPHPAEPDHKKGKADEAAGVEGTEALVAGAAAGAMEVESTSTAEGAEAEAGAAADLKEEGKKKTTTEVASGVTDPLVAATKAEEVEDAVAPPAEAAAGADLATATTDAPKTAAVAMEADEQGAKKDAMSVVQPVAESPAESSTSAACDEAAAATPDAAAADAATGVRRITLPCTA